MTDLFAYHLAKQQLSDLRQTAGQERLARTVSNHQTHTPNWRLMNGVVKRFISHARSTAEGGLENKKKAMETTRIARQR